MKNIWLSFDIEATGPVPGLHSMLSLGISAWIDERTEQSDCFGKVGAFSCNIRELDDCGWDRDTHEWWHDPERSAALELTRVLIDSPLEAMERLMDFLEGLPDAHHIWAAYPATFDMPFVRYYAQRFVRDRWVRFYDNPMERIACFDMGSYAMQLLGCDYHEVSKSRMPQSWVDYENPLPHVALNDAEEQARLLFAMLRHQGAEGE
jgi:hypothetical protein